MSRSVLTLAALGLLLVPDWATAFARRHRFRVCAAPPQPVYYSPPPATVDPPKVELPPLPAPGKADAGVPPVVLPQLPPIAPTGGLSESKYRPATADRPAFAVLPVDGAAPGGANPRWAVGFYNYTGRDLELRVGGSAVRLPARSSVTASVPGTFAWRVGGGADETTVIPPASGGVEIV